MVDRNKQVGVSATISNFQVIQAIRAMILDNEDFDARYWSIDDAETMERAARLIREGYDQDAPRPEDVERARKSRTCRVCGGPETPPFTLNYGREYAHTACLKGRGDAR